MPSKKPAPNAPVEAPFQGLFLDRPPHIIPPTGFSACNNVRLLRNRITSSNMGWTVRFNGANLAIPGQPICGGGLFTTTLGGYQYLIFATSTDVYSYNQATHPTLNTLPNQNGLFLITPIYATGTVAVSGTAVTGTGTHWATAIGTTNFRNNARVGDYISFGSATQNSPSATWYKITVVGSDTSLTLATSAGTIGAGSTYTLRQCLSNSPGAIHGGVAFENFPQAGTPINADACFLANGGGKGSEPGGSIATQQDPMLYWGVTSGSSGSATYMSSAAFTALYLRRINNVMVYGAVYGGSSTSPANSTIASSDNGLPTSLSGGVSFTGSVTDGTENISYLGILGNNLLIYTGAVGQLDTSGTRVQGASGGTVVSAQFVGLPLVWQFSTIIRGRGLLGSRLVAEFADRHEFLSGDSQYRYNGLFLQAMNDHLFRGALPILDYAHNGQAFVIQAPAQGDIIWALPTLVGAATQDNYTLIGYTEHYMEQPNNYLFKPFTQRDLSRGGKVTTLNQDFTCTLGYSPSEFVFGTTAGQITGPIVGDAQGNIYTLYDADIQSGAAFTSTVTFASRIIAGERARGLVKRIYPFAETGGNYNLNVALQMQDRVGGPITLTDTQTFNLATPTNRFTTHYRRGRVGAVTFSTPGPSQPWTLDGYDWDLPMGSPGGQR